MFFALASVATVGLTKSPMSKLSDIPDCLIWVSILFKTLYYSSVPEIRKQLYCLSRQLPSKDLSFTFTYLADAFIQSAFTVHDSAFRLYIFCQYVFPGNQTHNLCTANAML